MMLRNSFLFVLFCLTAALASCIRLNAQQPPVTSNGLHKSIYDGPAQLPVWLTGLEASQTTTHQFPVQPKANVYNVAAGNAADLRSKLTAAAAHCGLTGAVVSVPAGAVYSTVDSFELPSPNCDNAHWVVVQSASISKLSPQGTRLNPPVDAANMPTLTSSNGQVVIYMADRPSSPPKGYWLAGLNIVVTSGVGTLAAVVAGDYCAANYDSRCSPAGQYFTVPPSCTQDCLADRFVIDRSWIHPSVDNGPPLRHGIRFTASHFVLQDSVVRAISGTDQATGLSSDFSMGPVDLENNDISGFGECIILGGADPTIRGSVPSDIYIHHNYIHKPVEWLSLLGDMRNWFECKNCQRVLMEGNVFETTRGSGFTLTPRNAGGRCTWCVVQDVTVRYNKMSGMGDWMGFLGANGATPGGSMGPTLPFKRGSIHDNLVEDLDVRKYLGNGRWIQFNDGDATDRGCSGAPASPDCQVSDINITHNSLIGTVGGTVTFITFAGTPPPGSKSYNITITNNIVLPGAYAFGGDTGSVHPLTDIFGAYLNRYTFNNNVIANVVAAGYSCSDFPAPIQNFCGHPGQPNSMTAVGFVNYNGGVGGDYHLCRAKGDPQGCMSTSKYWGKGTDERNPGADVDALEQKTAGAKTGSGH
jgi:hypothetical protein